MDLTAAAAEGQAAEVGGLVEEVEEEGSVDHHLDTEEAHRDLPLEEGSRRTLDRVDRPRLDSWAMVHLEVSLEVHHLVA